jgi:hypothetical protein
MDKLIQQTSPDLTVATSAAGEVRDIRPAVRRHKRKRPAAYLMRKLSSGFGFSIVKVIIIRAIAFGAAWLVPGLIDSMSQRTLHRAAEHPDRSFVRTGVAAKFAKPTELVYRDRNGARHLILADEVGVNRFINDTLVYLDTRRNAIKSNTDQQVSALIEAAFSDGHECVSRYADWYFGWGRSWYLLKEGVVGAAKGIGPNNVQGFSEASRNEVEAYLIRNFQRIVLKPEQRNPVIESGVSKILAGAHTQYLDALTEIDERLQVFLRTHTHHLEVIDDRVPSNISLDWDAQKWKAPRYSVDGFAISSIESGMPNCAIRSAAA